MAVLFWAVGGVVASAVLHDDHSDYDNYDNYDNYSNYSDYAERKRRRIASLKSETESAASELSGYKRNIVNPQLNSQTLKNQSAMSVSEQEMNDDATSKINKQIEIDEISETSNLEKELKTINSILEKISDIERKN